MNHSLTITVDQFLGKGHEVSLGNILFDIIFIG